jgi:hypothetical protein
VVATKTLIAGLVPDFAAVPFRFSGVVPIFIFVGELLQMDATECARSFLKGVGSILDGTQASIKYIVQLWKLFKLRQDPASPY